MYFLYCTHPRSKKRPTEPQHLVDNKRGFAFISKSEIPAVLFRDLESARNSNYFPDKLKRYFVVYVLSGKWDFNILHIYSAKEWIRDNRENIDKEPDAMSDRLIHGTTIGPNTHRSSVMLWHDIEKGFYRNDAGNLVYNPRLDLETARIRFSNEQFLSKKRRKT